MVPQNANWATAPTIEHRKFSGLSPSASSQFHAQNRHIPPAYHIATRGASLKAPE